MSEPVYIVYKLDYETRLVEIIGLCSSYEKAKVEFNKEIDKYSSYKYVVQSDEKCVEVKEYQTGYVYNSKPNKFRIYITEYEGEHDIHYHCGMIPYFGELCHNSETSSTCSLEGSLNSESEESEESEESDLSELEEYVKPHSEEPKKKD